MILETDFKLAIHIFAIVANSAGCERAFSNFGITHTKLRNKIDPIRVHKMAVVGMQQKREDREAGIVRNRKKRQFGEDTSAQSTPGSAAPSPEVELTEDFRQYAEDLIQDAQISRDGEDDVPAAVPNPNPNPDPSSASRKTSIPLAKLFDYRLNPDDGLEFYWPGGKANLEADILAHEQALVDEFSHSS